MWWWLLPLSLGFAVGWRVRARAPEEPDNGTSARRAGAEAAFELARDQLGSELSGADADDVKALAFLALDLAAAALLVTVRGDLDRFWWAILCGLGFSGVLLVGAVWRREFETGPAPGDVYAAAGRAADAEEAVLAAMEGVVTARLINEGIRRAKATWYTGGILALLGTAMGSGIFLWQVH